MKWIKKYWKALIFWSTLIILAATWVMGQVFTDYAKTEFWWKFWEWAAWCSLPAVCVGIYWVTTKKKQW